MKIDIEYSGWVGMCPVYFSDPYAVGGPTIIAKYQWLEWFLDINVYIYRLIGSEGIYINNTKQLRNKITIEQNYE